MAFSFFTDIDIKSESMDSFESGEFVLHYEYTIEP